MSEAQSRKTSHLILGVLRFQLTLAIVAGGVWLLFWALHARAHTLSIFIYTFVAGNVSMVLIRAGWPLFEKRRWLWKWGGFIFLLICTGVVANFLAELPVHFWLNPPGISLRQALLEDAPFGMLVTLIVGILVFAFEDSRSELEARNRQLQSQVQLGLSEKHTVETDLDQAHEIQMHLLPRETPQLPGFQIACAWLPARTVSGDYFDVLPLGEGKLGLCIADVSGKGIAAALLMANLQASVKALAREDVTPSVLCAQLNNVLCDHIAPGRFVTLFYAVLDQQSHLLHFESAGHCLPLVVHNDGAIEIPEASSGVLGLFSHWTFSDHELRMGSGDVVVMMTDGVLEAWNAKEEEFGYKRLIESVLAARKDGAHGIRKRVLEDVTAFCNGKFSDDVSFIVVTVD